jgi:NhaP-type Na+/H+ or K+/H+ antiporter
MASGRTGAAPEGPSARPPAGRDRQDRHAHRVTDPVVETVLALITPYAAFVAGEVLHVSPVMAVIVAGLVIGGRREQQARGNERPCRDT